jgi:hypothetical protein
MRGAVSGEKAAVHRALSLYLADAGCCDEVQVRKDISPISCKQKSVTRRKVTRRKVTRHETVQCRTIGVVMDFQMI